MKRIMVFCDFYLPSYKSGGGMWTVVNLVDRFCDRYEFFVITRNYDSKGDTAPFTTVKTDEWNQVGNTQVYYFPKATKKGFARLVKEIKPDAFFLNSALALPGVQFLEARRKGLIDKKLPVILAPCGEFSSGALSIKPLKKKIFLQYARLAGLFGNVIWKASTESEKEEIQRIAGKDVEIWVAPDLPPRSILPEYSADLKPAKKTGAVRFVFVSRLVRKKNIHYFLRRLGEIKEGEIVFDLIGPLEDRAYWRECQKIIEGLPKNISVNVTGAFQYDETLRRVFENHFFVLPTLNENFGYVCLEGLAAGCPLLTSDRVIWEDIERENAGWRIPLEEPEKWTAHINYCLKMENEEYKQMSDAARQYAVSWLSESKTEEATAKVLERAVDGK